MAQVTIRDPVFGEGTISEYGTAADRTAYFTSKEFAPTKTRVAIRANVTWGEIPQSQRDLYEGLEHWYPRGVHDIFEAIKRLELASGLPTFGDLSFDQFQGRFQLVELQLGETLGFGRASTMLTYRCVPITPDELLVWISQDYRVEACGFAD